MNEIFNKIKGKLIVSCQALEDEPLFSSFIMGRMALAADQAKAGGIRANTVADIQEIKKNTNLPIIGIIKRNYGDCNVYITPTMKEIDELVKEGVDIIAIDATKRERPDKVELKDFVKAIKEKYPNQIIMGDISDVSVLAPPSFDPVDGGVIASGSATNSRHLRFSEGSVNINGKLVAHKLQLSLNDVPYGTADGTQDGVKIGTYSGYIIMKLERV